MSVRTIFITGITGCQGGAVARQALKQKWAVHAVARNPESAEATVLTSLGAKITRGDWDDEPALAQSLEGCTHLFLNLFPSFTDTGAELCRSRLILRLAKAAGVQHTIYTSLFHRPLEVPLSGTSYEPLADLERTSLRVAIVEGKAAADDAVRTNEFCFKHWTILRLGFFMANMLAPKCQMYGDFATTGTWTTALRPADRLPLTDHEDIARFALAAYRDPDAYHGREIRVASELRTVDELLAAIGAAAGGKTLRARYLVDDAVVFEETRKNSMLLGHLTSRNLGAGVDLDAIRAWGVPLTTFEEFLKRESRAVAKTYGGL